MAPVQVALLPITERTHDYARKVMALLEEHDIRCELDDRNEKIGYKIREAQMEKVPYMLVLGDKEQESNLLAVRDRKGETVSMTPAEFVEKIKQEVKDLVK